MPVVPVQSIALLYHHVCSLGITPEWRTRILAVELGFYGVLSLARARRHCVLYKKIMEINNSHL